MIQSIQGPVTPTIAVVDGHSPSRASGLDTLKHQDSSPRLAGSQLPPRAFETPDSSPHIGQTADEENFFQEQVEADARSLGYNFDTLRRAELMGQMGGTVPQNHAAPPSFSGPVTPVPLLPELEPPAWAWAPGCNPAETGSVHAPASRTAEYHSIATRESLSEYDSLHLGSVWQAPIASSAQII